MHQNHNGMAFTQLKELPFWHFTCWHLTQHKGIFPNTRKRILPTRKSWSRRHRLKNFMCVIAVQLPIKNSSCDAEAELHFREWFHCCYATCLISRTQNCQAISSIFSAFVKANMVCGGANSDFGQRSRYKKIPASQIRVLCGKIFLHSVNSEVT